MIFIKLVGFIYEFRNKLLPTRHCRNLGGQLYSQHYLATFLQSRFDRFALNFFIQIVNAVP